MAYESTWLSELDNEDINFIKKFILASGSLKGNRKNIRCFISDRSFAIGSPYTKDQTCR